MVMGQGAQWIGAILAEREHGERPRLPADRSTVRATGSMLARTLASQLVSRAGLAG